MEDKEKEIKAEEETEVETEKEKESEESKSFSLVSIAPNQKKLSFILFVLLVGGVLYYFLFSSTSTPEKKAGDAPQIDTTEKKKILEEAKPIAPVDDTRSIGSNDLKDKPLQAPEVEAPEPPPPPPPPVSLPVQPFPKLDKEQDSEKAYIRNPFSDDSAEEKKKQATIEAKMKAGIMVTGGGDSGSGILNKEKNGKTKKSSSGFLGFGDGSLDDETFGDTTFPKVKATVVKHLNRTILQGKIISAILETAINTDIPGMLRAIVTRDIYAERGVDIMIPKGSRLMGSYSANVKGGQTRVVIMWNRVIRPDGIDIAIDSSGVDALGRSGIPGDVYDHFWRQLGNAFLVSYVIPIVSAKIAEKMTKGKGSSRSETTNTDGSITINTTGSPVEQAVNDSTDQFSNITKDMIENSASTKPTITINQGTVINVLVQKDLIFPPQSVLQKRNIYK